MTSIDRSLWKSD